MITAISITPVWATGMPGWAMKRWFAGINMDWWSN